MPRPLKKPRFTFVNAVMHSWYPFPPTLPPPQPQLKFWISPVTSIRMTKQLINKLGLDTAQIDSKIVTGIACVWNSLQYTTYLDKFLGIFFLHNKANGKLKFN